MAEYTTQFGTPQAAPEVNTTPAAEAPAEMPAASVNTDPEMDQEEENEYIVKFHKPYKFEGREYTELDLSGLEDLTSRDLKKAELQYGRTGGADPMKEFSIGYTTIVASKATKMPMEFFDCMPARDVTAVKAVVMAFLLGED